VKRRSAIWHHQFTAFRSKTTRRREIMKSMPNGLFHGATLKLEKPLRTAALAPLTGNRLLMFAIIWRYTLRSRIFSLSLSSSLLFLWFYRCFIFFISVLHVPHVNLLISATEFTRFSSSVCISATSFCYSIRSHFALNSSQLFTLCEMS